MPMGFWFRFLKILKFQRGNSNTMGQRQGFAPSDLAKINKMYQCANSPMSPGQVSGNRPTFVRPTIQKPSRPVISGSSGGGGGGGSSGNGYTNPIAQFVGGVANIFSAFGGKHDALDNFENHNNLDEY